MRSVALNGVRYNVKVVNLILSNDFSNHLSSHVVQKSADIQTKTLCAKTNQLPRPIRVGDMKNGASSFSPIKDVIWRMGEALLTHQSCEMEDGQSF